MDKNTNEIKFRKLGMNVAYYRKLKGYSQEKLAEMLDVSRMLISRIEAPKGKKSFSIRVIFAIAEALEVSEAELFDFSR